MNSVYIKIISYKSVDHKEMINLRQKILRDPLGLVFSKEDIEKEKNDCLIGAYFHENNKLTGCCILGQETGNTARLRQMAVENICQKTGIGSMLLSYAEKTAINRGFSFMYLHAREVSVGFYTKNGYNIEGERFEEVGIPHFAMKKRLY